ncbi:MAG: PAS domain S-box protein [Chlorobi bacterium]|nr:PAS domain S-box protein [Chlorobiota bacterium]
MKFKTGKNNIERIGNLAETFDKKNKKLLLAETTVVIVFLALALFGLNFLLSKEDMKIRNNTMTILENSIKTSEKLIKNNWMKNKIQETVFLSKSNILVRQTINLIKLKKEGKNIFNNSVQKKVRRFVNRASVNLDFLEFFIISKDSLNIVASDKEKLGRKSDLWKNFSYRLRDAFDGEPQFSPIITTDTLFEKKIGATTKLYPTVFTFVPIKDFDFNIIAIMAIRYSPLNDLNSIIKTGDFGKTGEAYIISEHGTLLTQVRNTSVLRKLGILKPNEFSFCNIEMRDPGVNLLNGEQAKAERDKLGFTLSARELMRHNSGNSPTPYRNYYGAPVIGAWRWDDNLNVGFCAEIYESEAMESYYKFNNLIHILFLSIVALTILFIFLLKRRHKKEKKRILESENYYSEVLNRASSGIITFSGRGKIRTFNLEAEKIFGYEKSEIIGKDFSILFDSVYASQFDEKNIKTVIPEYSKDKEAISGKKKNGKIFPVKLILSDNIFKDNKTYIAIVEDLSEIVKAKSELKKSRDLYKKTYANAPIGLANINESGRLISANKYLLDLLGYSEKEFLTRTIYDFFNSETNSSVKHDFEAVFSGRKQRLSSKINCRKKNGNSILVSISFSKIFDETRNEKEFILILEDITEKQKYEEQLKEKAKELQQSNEELEKARMAALSIMQDANIQKLKVEQTIAELEKSNLELKKVYHAIEQISISVVITNRDGVIEYVNPFFTKTTGYSLEEVIGKTPVVLNSGKHSKEFYKDFWDTLISQKVWFGEFLNKRKNGELYWEKATISPLVNEKGEITHYVAVKEDITEKKKNDLELKEAKLAAEAATEAKSRFLASMSHEIRTPMNAIIGLTHLALQSNTSPKLTDYLSKIESSSGLLLNIINDILDFSKIEAGEMTIERVEFNLEDVLKSTINFVSQKAYKKGLELILDISSENPINLIGDPLRIGQILTNYANNAVKFTHEGEIVISANVVKETKNSVEILFAVKDTGIGIKEEHKSKLFSAFQQADLSTTRKFGGTGLGLVISQKLTHLMGGKTWFESEENVGSTFYFQVTFGKQKTAGKNRVKLLNVLSGKEVLFCDSNQKIRTYIEKILLSFGMNAHTVESSQKILKDHNESFLQQLDMVIIDYKNIKSDGIDIIYKISEKLKKDTPLIVTASLADMEYIEKYEDEMKSAEILLKPVLPSDLYNKIISFYAGDRKVSVQNLEEENRNKELEKIKGALVLLVEDNEINQQIASEILSLSGIQVEIAENGLEAVAMVKNSGVPSKYSLALMDIQMPYMDGFTATKEIKKLREYRELPIVAMTADAMQGVQEECYRAGMVDYLTKPIEHEKLFASLLKWIDPDKIKTNRIPIDLRASKTVIKRNETDFNLPEIDGIDAKEGLRLVGNNENLFLNLLLKFEKNYSGFENSVRTFWNQNEMETVLRMVHTLKGNSGSLGMKRLYNAVANAHSSLLKKETEEFEKVFADIFEELNKILNALKKWNSDAAKNNPAKDSNVKSAKPIEEVTEKLERLADLLKFHDSDAIALVKEIGIIKGYETESGDLIESVNGYRFEQSLEILARIK